jgi:hypothetical protein
MPRGSKDIRLRSYDRIMQRRMLQLLNWHKKRLEDSFQGRVHCTKEPSTKFGCQNWIYSASGSSAKHDECGTIAR